MHPTTTPPAPGVFHRSTKTRLSLLATLGLALAALFGAVPAMAVVSQIGTPSAINNNATLSNVTVPAGNNRVLVVAASASSASGASNISSVTYNGTAMTLGVMLADGAAATDSIWYLKMGDSATPSSAAGVVVTATGTGATVTSVGAVVFQGVDQTTPLTNPQAGKGSGGASTLTVTSAPGDLVFDLFDIYDGADTGTQTPGANQTVVHDVDAPTGGLHGFYKTTTKAGAASVPMSWTSSGSAYIQVATNLKQAVAGGPAANYRYVEAIEESNETPATATPLTLVNGLIKVSGNLFPNGDTDYYSFQATAGDRIYTATMTSASAGSSTDSVLTLLGSDGTTVIETDNDNGSFAALSSSIAGAVIPATGTYYLKVNDLTPNTTTERGYDLYLQVRSGTPVPETEPNDTPGAPNPGVNNYWVSGARNPAAATEQDWYPITLNAGDTVFLSLDLNPERDGVVWNGRLGFALFGDANNQVLPFDDSGVGDGNPSEAAFITVKTAGTYYVFVDSATAATGGPTATYHLNISVLPAINETWTPYPSTDTFPLAIGPANGLTSSTITVPGHPRIAKIRVNINATHALMADMDIHLRSPSGNDIGLVTDIGAGATGGQTQMDLTITDDAATPPFSTVLKSYMLKPELNYRLGWFIGEDAGGTWTLDIRDDTNNASGGTLNSWSLEIVEEPAPASGQVLFATDFESGAVGFIHGGTNDSWALGTPATVATTTANPVAGLSTANSGVNCWKTNLNGIYSVSSTQDLDSPIIDLTTYGPTSKLRLDWAMWYQMESANFDHAYVQIREVGGAGRTRKVWQWMDATMTDVAGNPVVNVPASSGWANRHADISDFAGKQIQVRFHLDSDTTVNFAGLAIDDVAVVLVGATSPEITISGNGQEIVSGDTTPAAADGTDFGSTAAPGGGVVRTFTIANSGTGALNLNGTPKVALSGTGAASFAVTAQPASPVAATNGSTTFDITFTPTVGGPLTATVTVANDDSDEGTYTFAITGIGVNAPIVVNTTDDSFGAGGGVLTLRDAIAAAASQTGASTITLPPGTITLTSALPAITHDTTITGAAGGTTMSGGGQFQVFNVTGGNVTFDGLTITKGLGTPGAPGGGGGTAGGLQIGGAANVTVTNCLFIGNLGGPGDSTNGDLNQGRGAGGGLQTNSSGTVTIRNSTFYGNVGGAGGGQGRGGAGGVQFENGINYFQSNTVAGNTGGSTAGDGGGGTGGAFTINQSPIVTNTIFADNTSGTGPTFIGGVDFGGTMSSGGYNLVQDTYGTDVAALQPSDLQNVNAGLDQAGPKNHGGPTRTIRLYANGKAIDAGKAPAGGSTDQRGQPRPVDLDNASYPNAAGGDGTDIGAYELQNAPIVVTNDTDTPVSGQLTLREAIALAESQPGDDSIVFNIPGAGVHTIQLATQLPAISQPLTIDGYSQPGAKANTLAVGSDAVLLIELQNTSGGSINGLNITGSGNTIRGLAIGGFEWGISLAGDGNVISGNFLGLHADGVTAFNNNYGVVAYVAPNSIIGGARPADRNVISGNNYSGLYLSTGSSPGGTAGTVVRGNYLGTNAAGTAALANGYYGVNLVNATGITVGGATPGAGNLVSGNFYHGVVLEGGSTGNTVQGNRIGTDATGTATIPNQFGVVTFDATGNTIGGTAPGAGNLISGNTHSGVYIRSDGKDNAIRGNRIYANDHIGILLFNGAENSVTPNDDGDADTGANNLQNFPVITSASVAGGNLTITGTLNSTADTAFALDFFVNDVLDPTGYGGGQTYLGSGAVTTVGNDGTFTVTLPGVTVPEETYLTATATDPTGNTSEFSLGQLFTSGTIQTGPNFVVNTTADSNKVPTTTECSLREAITAANAFNGATTITFDANVFATAQTITLTKGELQITNATTITGPDAGVTVDGSNLDRVLHVLAASNPVSISGLTMTHGNASGIYVETGTLTLQNCTLTQNSGQGGGGGIYNAGALTLQNCTISDNHADQTGGGVHNAGTLTVNSSTIANNTGGTFGGGIYNGGSATIRASTIAGNTAQSGAGGIFNFGSPLTVLNSTLSSNHVLGGGGGAIWSANSTVSLTNCTITANTVSTGSAGGVTSAGVGGNGGVISMSNTIVAGNLGTGGVTSDVTNVNGGAFFSKGYNLIGDGTGATGFTAGTLHDQVGTTANPIDPRLGPLANNGGPTLTHALLTTPVISPAIDAGNSGLDTDQRGFLRGFDHPATPNGSGNLSDIGAVEQDSTVAAVLQTGPNFVVNTAGDDDDLATTTNTSLREAIKAANGLAPGTATITFDPTVFATARTITLGGSDLVIQHAMTIVGPGADKLTISGNNQSRIFTINTADGLNTISGLTVTGGNGTGFIFGGLGGAIINIGDLLLVDCTITGSTATGSGGGFHNHTSATATLRGCTISNNTSTGGRGGGVNSFLHVTMTNCTVSGNHADAGSGDKAGGVWSARGNLVLNNCTITGNTASGAKSAGGVRSGTFGGSESFTVNNTIIAGNTGTGGATADVNDTNGVTITTDGFNLIGDGTGSASFVNGSTGDQVGTTANPLDPRLGPLANNGGPTPTHALLAFSPAIDKGKVFGGRTTDQRGLTRPIDLPNGTYPNAAGSDASDIGALEAQVEPPLPPYAGVDDAVATTTHGATRIYPLANDVSPSGRPLSLLSVSNPAIHIDGRSLI
ncbi:MAG TPA: choice-of-anchor Q domain-containing protein, partial [Chthoniobacteraceae bacterium]|nr:choice-of-anchor Q domain-containing protein [Chthoniobacteraceae bacterium]